MSRRTYFDEKNEEKEIIEKIDECRYKVNGICYNNGKAGYLRLGKKCYEKGDLKYCDKIIREENV